MAATDSSEPRAPQSASTPKPMLELRAVRKAYPRPGGGELLALELAELTVPSSCCCAVVGPNGSGKSTLLHVLAGLLRPDAGSVVVGGVPLQGMREADLDRFRARNVGYLLQGGQLMDCLSAEENVMAALHFAGRRRTRPKAQALLEQLGVAHRAAHLPTALSGGERQRVALARALANEPALLLADEPLASLDSEGAAVLAALFDTLVRERGLALVVATHQPERLSPDMVVELRRPASREGAS